MGGCGDGVNGNVGHGAVAALALHHDPVLLAGRHAGSCPGHQHYAGGKRQSRYHMDHHGRVHMGIFQHACADHIVGPLKQLLGRLEHQLDRTRQLVLMGFQQLGGAQQHRRVHIMAAAVHPARRFAAILDLRFFLDGQGVHIRTDQDRPAFLFAAGQGHQAAFSALLRRVAHFRQLPLDEGFCLLQVKACLRMAVNGAAALQQLRLKLFCLL